jgi:hypothetical protein
MTDVDGQSAPGGSSRSDAADLKPEARRRFGIPNSSMEIANMPPPSPPTRAQMARL